MTEERPVEGVSRREVLAGLGVAASGLFVPALVDWVSAQKFPKRQILVQVLNEAGSTGNMAAAVERQGKFLSDTDRKILLSITPEELQFLGSFRRKLHRLGVLVAR